MLMELKCEPGGIIKARYSQTALVFCGTSPEQIRQPHGELTHRETLSLLATADGCERNKE